MILLLNFHQKLAKLEAPEVQNRLDSATGKEKDAFPTFEIRWKNFFEEKSQTFESVFHERLYEEQKINMKHITTVLVSKLKGAIIASFNIW